MILVSQSLIVTHESLNLLREKPILMLKICHANKELSNFGLRHYYNRFTYLLYAQKTDEKTEEEESAAKALLDSHFRGSSS
jgi:hypothetical protein